MKTLLQDARDWLTRLRGGRTEEEKQAYLNATESALIAVRVEDVQKYVDEVEKILYPERK